MAHAELIWARDREADADAASSRADARTHAATRAWDAHLGSADFAPEFAGALARQLVEHEQASNAARGHANEMTEARGAAETAWRNGDARCRVADRALDESRRANRRDRDERLLEAMAERTVLQWRRS